MDQATEDVTLAWGVLPVEKYLLSQWDSSSTLPPEQQRSQLVQAFIQEDDITSTISSTAADMLGSERMEELIRTVLVPWRQKRMRLIAEKYAGPTELSGQSGQPLIVLRTYYGGGAADDDKLREWLEEVDPYDEALGGRSNHWWRVLNDPALFDMGSEPWQSVYYVLPELTVPSSSRSFTEEDLAYIKELAHQLETEREPDEEDYENAVMEAALGMGFLLIVDEQAFDDDEFGLVFRDSKGNVIKEGPIKPEEVQYLFHYHARGALFESEYWLDARPGKKYKTGGEIMRTLLPVVMADA